MNKTALQEILEIEKNHTWPKCNSNELVNSNELIDNPQNDTMTIGIMGCGAIASVITDFALEGKLGVDLKFFYDQDMERAENLSSKVDGITVPNVFDMLDHVDLVIEAASQQAVAKIIPPILKRGKDVIIMSVGALIDLDLKNRLETLALENNSRIYTPSGAIVGLDGIKAASIGNITEVNLVTRKPPESLGISIEKETILYEGKASEAVRKFPMNMNVAATLSIACNMETNVKIIADPEVQHNCHDIHVVGDFGELRTTTQNRSCSSNPKTSVLAAYSAIKLLKSLNENSRIGT